VPGVSWDIFFNASVSREQRDLNSRTLFTSRAGLPPVGFVLVGYSEAIVNWRKIAWLLKNSSFARNAPNFGDRKCPEN
jgi:hypothetical protein